MKGGPQMQKKQTNKQTKQNKTKQKKPSILPVFSLMHSVDDEVLPEVKQFLVNLYFSFFVLAVHIIKDHEPNFGLRELANHCLKTSIE